jgi:hypothetical protein
MRLRGARHTVEADVRERERSIIKSAVLSRAGRMRARLHWRESGSCVPDKVRASWTKKAARWLEERTCKLGSSETGKATPLWPTTTPSTSPSSPPRRHPYHQHNPHLILGTPHSRPLDPHLFIRITTHTSQWPRDTVWTTRAIPAHGSHCQISVVPSAWEYVLAPGAHADKRKGDTI